MSNKKYANGMNGKGYYIALILCAVAIGISGYLYYAHANEDETTLQNDTTVGTVDKAVVNPNVQVAVTDPTATEPTQPDDTKPTEGKQPIVVKSEKRVSPVTGETVMEYAMDCLSYNQTTRDWRVHDGVDIAAEAGTQVCAAADGTVYTVYDHETMGMTVVIRHNEGYTTEYSSLAEAVCVQPGDTVQAGEVIGAVGNTALLESAIGDHVHFSVSCNDVTVDPAQFLNQE